jgi:hypothetical protein
VDPRANHQKIANSNSPNQILFVIQRKTAKFLQKQFPHLVTQFPVCLRDLPFSELAPKFSNSQILSNSHTKPPISAFSRRPLIMGRRADLIFYVTRYNVTHLLIPFFIQDPFSHKFLKLS